MEQGIRDNAHCWIGTLQTASSSWWSETDPRWEVPVMYCTESSYYQSTTATEPPGT